GKSSGESQTGIARDAGTRIASALSASASTKEERVGSRGSRRAKSNLAVGPDQDPGGTHGGLGLFGECDRLPHEGNRELESIPSMSNGRSPGRGGTSACRAIARL